MILPIIYRKVEKHHRFTCVGFDFVYFACTPDTYDDRGKPSRADLRIIDQRNVDNLLASLTCPILLATLYDGYHISGTSGRNARTLCYRTWWHWEFGQCVAQLDIDGRVHVPERHSALAQFGAERYRSTDISGLDVRIKGNC